MESSTYIIAEAGVNHNGSTDLALRLVEEAHAAGADAVKFQTFKSERLVSKRAAKADYQKRATGAEESQLEMLRRLELDATAFRALANRAAKLGIEFLSTPFDRESLRVVVDLGVRRLKIGSGEITNAPLLRDAALTNLPIILSTGMSSLGDIEAALAVLASAYLEVQGGADRPRTAFEGLTSTAGQALLAKNVTLLHCTTEYPAPLDEVNLRAIATLRMAFDVPVGYSDHTEGIAVSVASVALGACVVEKHFTLDRTMPGPDHKASLEPAELRSLVEGVRAVERALGSSLKRPGRAERANLAIARRSVVAAVRIAQGETITADALDVKRPGGGISPMRIDEIIGRIAPKDFEIDDPIVF